MPAPPSPRQCGRDPAPLRVEDLDPGRERAAAGGPRRLRRGGEQRTPATRRRRLILVDTPIWIDHLHATGPQLVARLGDDEAGSHPAVIEELALGSVKDRTQVLALLEELWQFPTASHVEVVELVDRRGLGGRGLSAVDAHLLGSVALVPGARLWTRDKRLLVACRGLGLRWVDG